MFVGVEGEKKKMRIFLPRKGLNEKDVSSLEEFAEYGVTEDDVSEALNKFDKVEYRNKEDAMLSIYSMLLRGEFLP